MKLNHVRTTFLLVLFFAFAANASELKTRVEGC
jgi:hypothetical protein